MEIVKARTSEKAARFAGDALSRELIAKSDKPTLLLVSGGSSLAVLDTISSVASRSNMQVAQVDERWTKNERDLNSYAFKRTLFADGARKRGTPFISIDTFSEKTADISAQRHEDYLKSWRAAFHDGVVIALLGIGFDGHIAGVLSYPNEKDLFENIFLNTRRWVINYDTGKLGNFPTRITLTLHYLLQEVDASFVYVCGEEKKEALQKTLSPDGTFAETPARILNQMRGVKLFTDIVEV